MMKTALGKESAGRQAFTLLELVVSMTLVAIIAVVLTMSLRSVSKSRSNVQCVHQLRQVGAAMLNYISDSNQTLKSFHGGSNVDDMWSRQLFLGGYLTPRLRSGNEKTLLLHQIDSVGDLLRCPIGAIGPTFKSESPEVREHPRRWGWQSYGLGMYQSDLPVVFETDQNKKTTVSFQVKVANISEPSRYILLSDSAADGPNHFQSFRISRFAGEGGVALRHGGRANVFFLDGHMGAIDADEARSLGVPDFGIYRIEP